MARKRSRLKSLKYSPHVGNGSVQTMGFPPYNVVEISNGFTYHHSGLIPTYGVRVVRR